MSHPLVGHSLSVILDFPILKIEKSCMSILKVYKRTPHAKMTMPNLQRYPEKLRLIKDELDLPVFDYFIFSVKVTNFSL